MKNNKGITLVALVITIIVLLILAGVTIASLSGDNGILTRGKEAKQMDELGQAKDQINLMANEGIEEHYAVKYAGATTTSKESGNTAAAEVKKHSNAQATVEAYINTLGNKIGNVNVTFLDHVYTLTSSDGKKKTTGAVGTDGSVTWTAIADDK